MKKERVFRMKRFSVCHELSANKVGVDGVLVGAWAGSRMISGNDCTVVSDLGENTGKDSLKILDAGCGCGLIALMAAQLWESAEILGIDIERGAVSEAQRNVSESPWSDRITIRQCDFSELKGEKYGLILSNPPFFNSGVEADISARMLARHAASLSPEILLKESPRLLIENGRLVFIAPADQEAPLLTVGEEAGLSLIRLTRVRGNPQVKAKRVLMEWQYSEKGSHPEKDVEVGELIIEKTPGEYTSEYRQLCKDFYLKF